METLPEKKKTENYILTDDGLVYSNQGIRIRLHGVLDIIEDKDALFVATNHNLMYVLVRDVIQSITTVPYPLDSILSLEGNVLTYKTKDAQTKQLIISAR